MVTNGWETRSQRGLTTKKGIKNGQREEMGCQQ